MQVIFIILGADGRPGEVFEIFHWVGPLPGLGHYVYLNARFWGVVEKMEWNVSTDKTVDRGNGVRNNIVTQLGVQVTLSKTI